MRTTMSCLILVFMMVSFANAEEGKYKLTVFWESSTCTVSVSFLCDWIGLTEDSGEGLIIAWGTGDVPKTTVEMLTRCSGWRGGNWTRARLEGNR